MSLCSQWVQQLSFLFDVTALCERGHDVRTVLATLRLFDGSDSKDNAAIHDFLHNATQMVDMGFAVDGVVAALTKCKNDVSQAAAYLTA